jgi:hypothetical protein
MPRESENKVIVHVPAQGVYEVSYEEQDGYLISIECVNEVHDGEFFREINPSRNLYGKLVDLVQEYLDRCSY